MATTITDSGTVTTIPFDTPPAVTTPLGSAGITPGGVAVQNNPLNYTVIVQIPMPFLNLKLDINLLGDFILPALSVLGVPQAVAYFVGNATRIIQRVINSAYKLLRTYPQMTVTILVKVGPVIVVNVHLVAKLFPFPVPLPVFALALPDFVAGISLHIPFPIPPPVIIEVPIPVPIISLPSGLITGGNVRVGAGGGVTGVPISDQTYHPTI